MIRHFLPAALFLAAAPLLAQKTYTYSSVPGDPMGTRIYTLDNGFQVYMSHNDDAPRVQTNIAVRAGSKNDPADATGLAHYLEHMLFKGTSAIGTVDWTAESAMLQQISDLYEQRRTVTDEQQRAAIYHRIDSLSTLAAAFAVPNEYDKMVSSLGALGTNAFTSTERTVYVNDIPTEELERWMMIESVRFQECVLRLFHTELETVYEEFNRGQDNDQRNASTAMDQLLYKRHPYGTQTTIGTGEHLKNPSMVKIQQYFKTYYVPNNMALILAGDIDYDATIAMADKYFGGWQVGTIPPFTFISEEPIKQPEVVEVNGPMAEWVSLGWRFGGYRTDDALMLELIRGILSNGRAGLIDLNLLQEQKVLSASAFAGIQTDYSQFNMRAEPRQGQTLEEARDLLLGQVELVKQGAFDDWMIEAVVNNYRQQRLRQWTDNNGARASALTDAFILRKRWEDVVHRYDRMALITKQEVMDFATKRFGENYACVFKRTGENTNAYRVPKPPITPIDINREGMSEWRKNWEKVPAGRIDPQFVDYDHAIARRTLTHGVPFAYVANPSNELFSLFYILDMGTNNDREMDLAVELLPYLGTGTYSPADFRKELFRLGLSLGVSVSEDRVYVSVGGLEQNLDKGVELLEHLLADARPDEGALGELIADIVKERQDNMKNKGIILNGALYNYARFGDRSPFNDVMSESEMRSVQPAALVERIHGLTRHVHRVFYYGSKPMEEVAQLLDTKHMTPEKLDPYPAAREYKELATTGNTVLFVDHDMVQTEMIMVSKAGPFDPEVLPYAALFNEYFGSGLSSMVFQEIREAKALAYSASAAYTTPSKKEEAHFVRASIGTQADKLGDAVDAMLALMNDMPMDEPQFEGARDAALRTIASTRITKENIFWSWDAAQRRGIDHDVRKDVYERIPTIGLASLKEFFDRQIKGRHYTFLVIGKESTMDMSVLEKLGPVRKLSKQEIFGYEQVN